MRAYPELIQQSNALCIELRARCSGLSSNGGGDRLLVLAERGCRGLESSLEVFDQDEKLTVLLERVRDLRLESVTLGPGSF